MCESWTPRWHTTRRLRHPYETRGRHNLPVQISRADFADPRLAAFLQAHLDDMEPTAPPESRHALDLTALQGDGVRLWVGTDGDDLVATAALAALDDRHEELKSMRTDPALRGRGLASRMLAHVLDDARSRGVERVSLETGSMAFFEPARRFYARAGFVACPPFGSYVDDPNSTFMTLDLPPRQA
ncbi:GNAT family N-acetyltransferase [Nocardioides ganghwensis]|uniref:GNAT family N-acetyltransferase n=1 Tax=Nocardioides ganghwensis TaxID=252230 RepID=UPI001A92FB16|nr:GNAT family N-acetyltransferase [Nocardioides ganghwensis]